MAVSPTIEARRWIYATLAANAGLATYLGARLYNVPAPADAVDPFFAVQEYRKAEDVYTNGASLVMTHVYIRGLVAQQGSSASSPFDLEAINNLITPLLHAKSGTTATASIQSCVRDGPAIVPLISFDNRTGRTYTQLGSDWHLVVK